MIEGFSPIIGENPKYLILGSAPSVISLKQREYYGNKQNSFWQIVSAIFNGPKLNTYQEKTKFILDNNIILWDVVKTCSRKGSLDSEIKSVVANDLQNLIDTHSTIEKVIFNGKMSEKLYKRHINYYPSKIQFKSLPSSSPAYTLKVEEKIKIWKDFILN
jgi:TDG/mug DNA glycosylase family protein